MMQACPCGRLDAKHRPLPYAQCCQPWHEGGSAPDAHALMRSRYSAFALMLTPYLLATWHPSRRPESIDLEPDVRWLGLEVRRHTVLSPTQAQVEFVARSRQHGKGHRLHEVSNFVYENQRWWYVDGQT
jgi:SEC-C motif domain protein